MASRQTSMKPRPNVSERQVQDDLADADASIQAFSLEEFFPYRVRMFYAQVTAAVSEIYGSRYGMSPSEWRTMAVLGPERKLTANEIVECSSMDKVSVSRAVARLRKRGWIIASLNESDARSRYLGLTEEGRAAFFDLVPRVLEVERRLLAPLSPSEARELMRLMDEVYKGR